jgi:predicted dienelactone hydrolase
MTLMKLIRIMAVAFACQIAIASTVSGRDAAQAGTRATFKVGVTNRVFTPREPYEWRGAKTHELITTVWYPADRSSVETDQWIGRPGSPLFSAEKAALDARPAASSARYPLIVLSHGTGGSALQMAWLGTALAAHGYIAAGVNHPGNNALEAYTPLGFSVWWERAKDLSTVIDGMFADPSFSRRIDSARIGAAGFSLGGYTMIEIAGGITKPSALIEFCKSAHADGICKSPPEFPQLWTTFERLSKSDPAFQRELRKASNSYRDPRIRAVFAMAPALGPAFTPEGLRKISIPVRIVAGAADKNVPIGSSAKYFATHIAGAKLTILPDGVGHYVFLDRCMSRGKVILPILCSDAPSVDRAKIHSQTARLAISFFDGVLK